MSITSHRPIGQIPRRVLLALPTGSQNRHLLTVGTFLIIAALAWITFRMARRLTGEPYIDFLAFQAAAQAARSGQDIYRAGQEMYIYPPMLAAWMTPIATLPIRAAGWIWYAIALTTTLLALKSWWRVIADRFQLKWGGLIPALGLTLVAWNEQLRREFETGQCDWLWLAPLMVAFVCLHQLPWLAGLLIGFATNIKYLPLLIILWLAFRRRRAAIAAMLGVIVWSLLPASVLGWERNLEYLGRALSGLGKLLAVQAEGQPGLVFPIEYEYSVSIPSGAARLAQLWGAGFGFVVIVVAGTALLMAAIAWTLYRRHGWSLLHGCRITGPVASRDGCGLEVLEWLGILTVMMAFSPQTQSRHLFAILPTVLFGAALLVNRVETFKVILALSCGVLGTAFLGSARDRALGVVNWGFVGGGGIAVAAMYLLLLDVGLRRIRKEKTDNKSLVP